MRRAARLLLFSLAIAVVALALLGGAYFGLYLEDPKMMFACGVPMPLALIAVWLAEKLEQP